MTAAAMPARTAHQRLDEAVHRVKDGSRVFARLSLDERLSLLQQMHHGYRAIAEAKVRASCEAKGIDFHSPLAGEEWMGGPMVTIRNIRLLIDSLKDIKKHGAPRIDASWLSTLPDGRLSVKVFPNSVIDATLLAKHTAEVHMQEGVTAQNLREHQASFYRKPHEGRVCLVLGAGNQNSIPPMDCLYKLFVEGTVCVLKMNPVNAYVGPFIEQAFKCLVDRGFLAVVYGGAEEGSYLVNHPAIDEIHITGSDKTHDLMVWGPPGPEREQRLQKNEPLLKKDITSELGNVTPVIVVPGPYTGAELAFQGMNIAGMVAHNASFNCNAAKLLVVPKGWNQRAALNELIASGLGRAEVRKAYYPGAEERWKAFTENRPGVKVVGNRYPGALPYALIPDVNPNETDRVFKEEPWCAVLSETALEGADPVTFLHNAVKFVNDQVWGTLAATVIVHPATLKDPATGPEVEKALRQLRYGSVCLNTWAGAVYGLGNTPWGGHPSSTLKNIQSGRGWVHNTYMLEDIEKTVLRAPVKVFPIQPWFPGHRTAHLLGQRLIELEMGPSFLKLPGVVAAALRA